MIDLLVRVKLPMGKYILNQLFGEMLAGVDLNLATRVRARQLPYASTPPGSTASVPGGQLNHVGPIGVGPPLLLILIINLLRGGRSRSASG